MSWKRVTLYDGIKIEKLQNGYKLRWQMLGAPRDAIVSINEGAPGEGLHIYFSPSAVVIAGPLLEGYGPVDCVEPDPTTVVPFVRREE